MGNSGRVELLAPAGSPDGFYGAVRAGADAVYLGGSRFGARAYAENFTEEELVACIRYGRLFGVKVYLTVNTLLRENELRELPGYLEPYCRAGLDAVIVQDLGVLRTVREYFPQLKIHASTQMSLCSRYGAELLRQMGASRIVPARELSLQELEVVRDNCDIELETFIHGAMCYCYSGQCLFSSMLGGRSGNRGRCAQPCRLPYTVHTPDRGGGTGEGACYPLSLKDMCTIDDLPALIEAGIASFKIEGRMKRPEYAAGVTAIYRKYIDRYYSLRDDMGAERAAGAYRVSEEDRRMLSSLYIRSQVHNGYYRRRNGRDMVTLENPAYSAVDEELLSAVREKYLRERPHLPVTVEACFVTGQAAEVELRLGRAAGRAVGGPVQAADKRPVTEEDLRRQLGKLGDSPFCAAEMKLRVSEDAFYPLGQVNELRRQAAERLEEALLPDVYEGPAQFPEREESRRTHRAVSQDRRPGDGKCWVVSVRTPEQLRALASFCDTARTDVWLRRIYVDQDLLLTRSEEVCGLCGRLRAKSGCERMAALSYIVREEDIPSLEQLIRLVDREKWEGYLVRSLDALGFLRSREKHARCRTDAGVYVWNSRAAQQLSRMTEGFCIPYELNGREQSALMRQLSAVEADVPCEKIVYGRIPMMITANCVLRTANKCGGAGREGGPAVTGNSGPAATREGGPAGTGNGGHPAAGSAVWLTDRYRKNFPVLADCRHCMNILYNSVPLVLPADAVPDSGNVEPRLDFTLESGRELVQILEAFLGGGRFPAKEYTTGHEKRGAE